MWIQGGWTVIIDELFYVDDTLKLRSHLERLYTQGRSKGITVVAGMQRPVAVTRFALSQSAHVLTFRVDGRDAKTLSDATSEIIRKPAAELGAWQFVWFYRPKREYIIGRLNLRDNVIERMA